MTGSKRSVVDYSLKRRVFSGFFGMKERAAPESTLLFCSDLHGNRSQYEKVFQKAILEDIDRVIIGGDLAPKSPSKRTISSQRKFYQSFLFGAIERYRSQFISQRGREPQVFLLIGNDDFRSNFGFLKENSKKSGFEVFCNHTFDDHEKCVSYVFYSYVPYTPFIYKDWEKPDVGGPSDVRTDARLYGKVSRGGELVNRRTWRCKQSDTSIYEDLGSLFQNTKFKSVILVSHAPPAQSCLDVTYSGEHVGSRGVRKAIKEFAPKLSLHGHIHETVEMSSGKFSQNIGPSVCATSGNFFNSKQPWVVSAELNRRVRLVREQL